MKLNSFGDAQFCEQPIEMHLEIFVAQNSMYFKCFSSPFFGLCFVQLFATSLLFHNILWIPKYESKSVFLVIRFLLFKKTNSQYIFFRMDF